MMARHWTAAERKVISDYGSQGVDKVAAILKADLGSRRTAKAIRNEASLMGISLARHATCPVCGRWVKTINPRTGYCVKCHANYLNDRANERLRQAYQMNENEKEAKDALPDLQRENARIRSQIRRKRGYGTKNGTSVSAQDGNLPHHPQG